MNEQQRIAKLIAKHRKILLHMMLKITGYYVVLGLAIAMALAFAPGLIADLPLGGLGDIADPSNYDAYELEEALLSADDEEI